MTTRTPYKGRDKPASQKAANRAYAQLRGPGGRTNAQLKTWRILRKLRCCPRRAGELAKSGLSAERGGHIASLPAQQPGRVENDEDGRVPAWHRDHACRCGRSGPG